MADKFDSISGDDWARSIKSGRARYIRIKQQFRERLNEAIKTLGKPGGPSASTNPQRPRDPSDEGEARRRTDGNNSTSNPP
jgi:hypothetical protein